MVKKNIFIYLLIVIFIASIFLILTVINIKTCKTNNLILNSKKTASFSKSTKALYLTPTIDFQNYQTYEMLSWKRYSNNEMGISFDYPDNLDRIYPGRENPITLEAESNKLVIPSGMGEIFSVEKIITNDDVETWWKKNSSENNKGNGLMPAEMTKTFFRNKVAYYFAVKDQQQIPSDYYIIPFQGFLLMISFQRYMPVRDIIDGSCNEYGECDINSLYSYRDYDESFFRFNNLIVNRILSSIDFSF